MENHKIERILKPMLGKFWTYQKHQHYLKDFLISEKSVKLICDGPLPTITILREDFDEVINMFYPANTESAVHVAAPANKYLTGPVSNAGDNIMGKTIVGQNAARISEIIMDSITKLQADPGFIQQAEAINSQVKSLIDLGKSEIEMFKVAAYMSKN